MAPGTKDLFGEMWTTHNAACITAAAIGGAYFIFFGYILILVFIAD